MLELFGPKTEEKVLNFWKENQTFEKSLAKNKKGKKFVFFEGPPFPNAKAHIGNVLTRCYKDIILRYKTMTGFNTVGRRGGWDVHGLPVELQLEKQLGLKGKPDIEKYGIAKFNAAAREMVWGFKQDWDNLTERMGFWIDLKNPYITYDPHYIETLWYLISKIAAKKLLYQDFKVVPYCPRCGTPLSSFEVAQGYETVKEQSVYVKFEIRNSKSETNSKFSYDRSPEGRQAPNPKEYFLVWTTTPWTLPANVALAVGSKIKYTKVRSENEIYILAKERLSVLKHDYEIIEEMSGKELAGLKYEPLFDFVFPAGDLPKGEKPRNAYRVVLGDFVSTEEGTGIVHIAPAFGEDDMKVAKVEKLPVIGNVDLEGKFKKEVKPWAGIFVKDADKKIIEDLKNRSLLLRSELYEHEYPFCWRCKTPLLYYAKSSWFIRMEKLRAKLLANNQKINWIPSHIKKGRFGEWLREVKDWAFSRERFWGTPLPVWQCKKCLASPDPAKRDKAEKVIGSLAELDKLAGQKLNSYIFLRHGEAENNRLGIISSWPELKKYPLTLKGVKEVELLTPWLKKQKIDLIFSSDVLRAAQTAQIVASALGKKVIFDKRLREHGFGVLNGHLADEWHSLYGHKKENQYIFKPASGENLNDVQVRMMNFLKSLDKKYQGKKILIVSHADPILAAGNAYQGYSQEEISKVAVQFQIDGKTGSTFEMPGHNWPYNDNGDLDLHRPYVDHLVLECPECGGPMKRVKEVIDVWFDSGAMPFAQVHYPFYKKDSGRYRNIDISKYHFEYPADFISEGVDQTRGWFYTLHAVGALMGKGPAFKNVISLGHVLDEKGEKMSKSKGNVVDPMDIINKYGIDALRWYFFTVNPPGEPKRFVIRDVEEKLRRFILTLWNVLAFYKTYAAENRTSGAEAKLTRNILDSWILSRLNFTIKTAKHNLDQYEVTQAARAVENLVDDVSRWWLRRSRKRFPQENQAILVLRELLQNSALILAPFVPFLAEAIWQELGCKESVHLEDWPKHKDALINKELERKMDLVRGATAKALALRAEAGIKVRQPLSQLQVPKSEFKFHEEILEPLLELIKDEVNVKNVSLGDELKLDKTITSELKEEGLARELIRQIQDMRRDAGLVPRDRISVYFNSDSQYLKKTIERWHNFLKTETGADSVGLVNKTDEKLLVDRHLDIENQALWIGLAKIR